MKPSDGTQSLQSPARSGDLERFADRPVRVRAAALLWCANARRDPRSLVLRQEWLAAPSTFSLAQKVLDGDSARTVGSASAAHGRTKL